MTARAVAAAAGLGATGAVGTYLGLVTGRLTADLGVGRRERPLGPITVEAVTLQPPERMASRVVRGPVPHVAETFTFAPSETGTRLTYEGTLGTDLWALGAAWGDLVARTWTATVEGALATIRTESEIVVHERDRPRALSGE